MPTINPLHDSTSSAEAAGPSGAALRLRGVRTHNLKGIDLDLPRNSLVVISGVSGSGKSSLAFDTLFAEGQRRYIETFSPYVRQFLGKLDKPDADLIDGLPAAIAVSQRAARRSARATVASMTELQDSLAHIYTRLGDVICPTCNLRVRPADTRDVETAIDALPAGTRYQIGFPVDLRPETDRAALFASLRDQGFARVRSGETTFLLEDAAIPAADAETLDVIVDRLERGKEPASRRRDSIETALSQGLGRCRLIWDSGTRTFVRAWRCSGCGEDFARPEPRLFKPSSPLGACPHCDGAGHVIDIDMQRVVPDTGKSLAQGAIVPWTMPAYRSWNEELIAWCGPRAIPVDRPFRHLDAAQVQAIVQGDDTFSGLRGFIAKLERKAFRTHIRVFLNRWRSEKRCDACIGTRLRREAAAVRVLEKSIGDIAQMTIADALAFIESLTSHPRSHDAGRYLAAARERLRYLSQIGLDYITLDRPARSLSTGEARRVALTKALGSGLVNALYVLDEPSIGLHPRDIERLNDAIGSLKSRPNTVVVVDHDQALMRSADTLVDIGPGAGEAGGRLIHAGPPASVLTAPDSITGDFLAGRRRVVVPYTRRKHTKGRVSLLGATGHNLKSIDAHFPLNTFCVVTGVSGAGKSTLVEETLFPALLRRLRGEFIPSLPYAELRGTADLQDAQSIDASPIGRTPRSNPATYLKIFDEIRKAFAATHEARLRNYKAGRFSFNVEGGRCDACEGNGYQIIDMQFLSDVMMRCPECRGRRFRKETLEITYRGKDIAEVLDLTAREAFGFFRNRPAIQYRLKPLIEVGLDYLRLGQPANTLSGGESQRLKLAAQLALSTSDLASPKPTLFVLEEPTSGLHPADIVRLIECLNALVDRGHTVLVVEHSPEMMISADWIIDLGPDAGAGGGRIVAEGTPESVAETDTHTGRVIAEWLARDRALRPPDRD